MATKRPYSDAEAKQSTTDAPPPLAPGLYVVSTPIGNAADITLRALDILRRADALAAEDTRTLRRLMEIHGVARAGRPMIAYHDHNGPARRPEILARLADGQSVALTSEAGTPLLADPGCKLVEAARNAGAEVIAAPGASALLTALAAAGLPTDRFLFAGFPPVKPGPRRRAMEELRALRATLVFYESPRRLAATLTTMTEIFGADRQAAICRELTKMFEEVRRGAIGELAAAMAEGPPPKGEVVLVIGPPAYDAQESDLAETLDAILTSLLPDMSVKDAAAEAARRTGAARKDAYAAALRLTGRD